MNKYLMDNIPKHCSTCNTVNISRICKDCGNKSFCDKCFIEEHRGISTQNHTVLDPKFGKVILDSSRSMKSDSLSSDPDPILADILSQHSSITDDAPENPNSFDPTPIKSNKDHSFEMPDVYSNAINNTILCPNGADFLQSLSSTQIEDQCHLFESGKIKEFHSIEELCADLHMEKSAEIRVPIITFIGKPVKEESVANILLLTNNTVKFVEGTNRTQNPLCTMIYDSVNHLLVLETQNMYKEVPNYIHDQNVLWTVILALSDVIIFSENEIRKDYIRIHNMMKNCKTRFGAFFSKIDKANPEHLAPGLIYLQFHKSEIIDSLSTVIKNTTDRGELFSSYNEIVFIDINKRNDFENFHTGLKQLLTQISKIRNTHSLEEILSCIRNCKESSPYAQDNVASNDIPNSWFLCNIGCQICQEKCIKSFDHKGTHASNWECLPNNQNEVYFCKQCMGKNPNDKGKTPLVLKPMSKEESFWKNIVSYPFRFSLVECDTHGIIHDNNWLFASYNAGDNIHTEYHHKWPGERFMSEHVYPMGQIIIDKVNEISDPVVWVVTRSTEYVSDTVQPVDWQSTSGTSNCSCCREPFTKKMAKHHCRNCKLVICSSCCDPNQSALFCIVCINKNPKLKSSEQDPKAVTILNIVRDSYQTCSSFVRKTVSNITRPDYWENDEIAIHCFLCGKEFHREINPIHHCRACGKCVCDRCSQNQRPVEWRCLSDPRRICDRCTENQNWKKPFD